MASKYTDEEREEAALILQICASNRDDGAFVMTTTDVSNYIRAMPASRDLSHEAYMALESWSDCMAEMYAEAEAMLRTGWEP